MPTNIADWSVLVTFLSSPLAMVVLTFFVWKMTGEMKDLKAAHKELNKSIHENGFLKKSDMDQAWKTANEIHDRHSSDIRRLEDEVRLLRKARAG